MADILYLFASLAVRFNFTSLFSLTIITFIVDSFVFFLCFLLGFLFRQLLRIAGFMKRGS